MTSVIREYHELETSPIAHYIGASNPPDDFYNLCDAQISCDENGDACQLRLSCCLGEMCWSRVVDLSPIVEAVKLGLSRYHSQLHGEMVAGWSPVSILKKAKRVAVSVAKNKAVKSLWKEVSPHIKQELISKIPGGTAAYKYALKASRALEKAREGNPQAVAAIKALAAKAETSSDAAKKLEIVKALHYVSNAKEAKAQPEKIGLPLSAAHLRQLKAKKAKHKRIKRTERAATPARNLPPRVRASVVPPQPVQPQSTLEPADYSEEYDDDYSQEYYDDYPEEVTSGWFFNHPYRGVLSAALDKTPGRVLRSLYHGGLETILAR